MIRTWKCLLEAVAVCALLSQVGFAQVIESDEFGVARVQPDPLNAPRSADILYGSAGEAVWLDDFQPPPGVGVDSVTIPHDGGVGYAVTDNIESILYRLHRVNGDYAGLQQDGYTSVGAFIPLRTFDGGSGVIAADPRGFVSDSGRGGLNLGLTARRYAPAIDRVFVLSNWFDYDEAGFNGYAQWGLHAASIGRYYSIRGNINLPFGDSHAIYGKTTTPNFFQNSVVLANSALMETAYQKYDVEYSTPIPYFARYGFELGVGYYYLNGAASGVEDGHGVSTRVEAQITEDAWVNALITSDGVFGENVSFNFELTLPDGAPSRMARRLPVRKYVVQSDKRTYRVLRDVTRRNTRRAALSSSECFAGQPISVVHIDPNALTNGDGSFENPLNSILALESMPDALQSQYEIILTRGNADGSDTNLNTTITLFDCQRLLGTGVDHTFTDAALGILPLPVLPFSTPLLTNSQALGRDVVTLADHNEVSGFIIDASGGTFDSSSPDAAMAINGLDLAPFDAGDPTGVRDFNINRNTIQNSTFGVRINTEATAGAQTGIITGNAFVGNVDDAVNLNVSGLAELALTIEDNTVLNSAANIVGLDFLIDGFTFGAPYVITNTSQIGFDILGFTLDLSPTVATVPPGLIWDTIEPGVSLPFQPLGGSDVTTALAMVNGNTVTPGTNPLQDGLGVVLPGGGVPDDQPLLSLAFTDFNPGESFTWEIDVDFIGIPNSGTFGNDLIGSAITVNFTGGLFLSGALSAVAGNPDASQFVATGGNLPVTGTGDGFQVNLADAARIVAGSSISRNSITGVGGDGISINGPGTASAIIAMSDNTITGAGRHGLLFTSRDAETIVIDGDRNFVSGSGGDGLHMETYGTSDMTVTFRNSTFDNNDGRGINGKSFDASTLNFALTSPFDPLLDEDIDGDGILDPGEIDLDGDGIADNFVSSASNNGGPGIQFEAAGASTQNILIDDVLVDPNTDAGIVISAAQSSLINVEITNSEIINTVDGTDPDLFGDGIVLRTSGTAELNGLVADNLIDGNEGHGFRTRASEASTLDFDLLRNTITNNGGVGIFLERFGSAVLTGDIIDNIVDGNGGNAAIDQGGLLVRTDGGNVGVAADTNIFILRNEFTDNEGGDGMAFETNGASVLQVSAIGNLVDGNGVNGVRVTTNGGSFFGTPSAGVGDIGSPSIFDSNIVTNNGNNDTDQGAGFLLQTNDFSTLVVDITSIEAAIAPALFSRTLISGNFDGIRAEHRGLINAGDQAITSIRVGTAFSFPDADIFDVVIEENTDDGIDIDILNPGDITPISTTAFAGGLFNFNVSDTLIRGGRAAGALADPGVSILHSGTVDPGFVGGNATIANIVFGGDISDAAGPFGLPRGPVRDPLAGVFNNDAYSRAGVIITDVEGDGINVVYENSDGDTTGVFPGSTSQLNLRLFDSLIGQSAFGFNTGDGLDITVDNAGDFTGDAGLDVIVDNTRIIGNGGDGVRLRTIANQSNLINDTGDDGIHGLEGQIIGLFAPDLSDTSNPPDGVGDTIRDGPTPPPNGDITSDIAINAFPFVLDPPGFDNGYGDLTSFDDFIADLQIINGSRVDFNGLDGLNLEIGTATRQRVSLQNSSFSGNGAFEMNITTFASYQPNHNHDVDRGQPALFDQIELDPTAKLDLYFGSLNLVRNTPAGFPEPGPLPVPAEFLAAVGGEGFNTSSSTRVNVEYLSSSANGFQNATTFKFAGRPANLFISALIPEDAPLIDDVDIPLPNKFLNFGAPFDEILFFTNSLPSDDFTGLGNDRYLNLNTP